MKNINRHMDLGKLCLGLLKRRYEVRKEDIGSDAYKKAKGMVFTTASYTAEGVGHFCIVRMNGFLGLMKMETAVFTVTEKDVPLINLDWVSVCGRETMMIEMYDDQLTAYPENFLRVFEKLKERDADIPDGASGEHWYDTITYPCSYHKIARKQSGRFNAAAACYFEAFLQQTEKMPACEEGEKRSRAEAFAERLFSEGGPAVDQVKKLFGHDFAKRLVLHYMYGAGGCRN